MPKTFFFLSGLPRSGSTLLGAILSQNPEIFVTPTSPLLDLLCHIEQSWTQIRQTQTWPDSEQLTNVYGGVIQSIFQHIDKPVIIDKHRGWPRNISGVRTIYGRSPKIICTVRDITEVLASYLLLARSAQQRGEPHFVEEKVKELGLAINDENLCRVLWEHYISNTFESIHIGFRTEPSCIHFVEYRDLVDEPLETIQKIYRFLELPEFSHQFQQVNNPIEERDELWGMSRLHVIRSEVKKNSPPAYEILGEKIYRHYRGAGLEFWRNPGGLELR